MLDPRVQKMARLLVEYCVAVQPGDKVMINGSQAGYPLIKETYREVIRAGGHPLTGWREDGLMEILLREGSDEQLNHLPEPVRRLYQTYDCTINIGAATNTRILSSIDPARQRIFQMANREIMATVMKRSAAGEFRWVGTIFPTAAYAQDADMSLDDFEDFVYNACHLDKADPIAAWRRIGAAQEKLIAWLSDKKQLEVKGPNVDLRLAINGRTFINGNGRNNMPCGEIFTGPIEDSVSGWVRFSYPAIHQGREVEGIELRFENGRVVDATARKNEPFLLSVLDTDPGARYLGEFAIGTNHGIERFTRSILFDEKIGGTIHMAVGAGYPESGSKNQSAVHWDMICDMRDGGQIWADGELFYDSGQFVA